LTLTRDEWSVLRTGLARPPRALPAGKRGTGGSEAATEPVRWYIRFADTVVLQRGTEGDDIVDPPPYEHDLSGRRMIPATCLLFPGGMNDGFNGAQCNGLEVAAPSRVGTTHRNNTGSRIVRRMQVDLRGALTKYRAADLPFTVAVVAP